MTAADVAPCGVGVDVRIGPVERQLAGASSSGVLWQAAPGRFLLSVPGVGRYLVEDGRMITVDPLVTADPAEVERFLWGTPLAVVHLQRGSPVLHAAVVERGEEGAIVLAGHSSAGKSVLAATLWARGYGVLSDDLAPLSVDDSVPVVLPTAGEVILWPDAVEWLSDRYGWTADGPCDGRLAVCGPAGRRRRIDVTDSFVARPRPLRAIWRLGTHHLDEIEVCDVRGVARFDFFGTGAVNSRIACAVLDRQAYFAAAGSLAASAVPIGRMQRPLGRWCVEELADLVEHSGVA